MTKRTFVMTNCVHVSKNGRVCNRKAKAYEYCTKCLRIKCIQEKLGITSEEVDQLVKKRTPPSAPTPPPAAADSAPLEWEEEDIEQEYDKLLKNPPREEKQEPSSRPPPSSPPPEEGEPEEEDYPGEEYEEPKKKITLPTKYILSLSFSALGSILENQVPECMAVGDDLAANEELLECLEEIVNENLGEYEMTNSEKALALTAAVILNRVAANMSLTREELSQLIKERKEARKPQGPRERKAPVF